MVSILVSVRKIRSKPAKQMGFPGGSAVKNLPAMWETQVRSLSCKEPLEEGMATDSGILAWKIPMDREAWQVTWFTGSQKSQMLFSE